ncbi:MAG: Si-specific NAD(P)(+) transhydrogenase, partial [Myxococcales bacterium]
MADVESFDLVVIGSGPSGEKGAALAAWAGKRVAVVERMKQVGGACVHTGTLPSKTLRETALYLTGFRRRQLYGMTLKLDKNKGLRHLMGRLRDVTERQVHQISRNFDRHQVTQLKGSASFVDPHTVAIAGPDGEKRVRADYFLIATGSSPLPPRGITFADPDVVDSDRLLDLDRIPRSLAVVGGGVIGCEYACIFAALGTEVTLIEGRDRLMGFIDHELSSAVKIALERMGGEVLLGDAVDNIERAANARTNALRMRLKSGRVLKADKILFSAGRAGNTRGMGLEEIGVNVDERGRITVDEHFRTSVPHIYAAGDVVGNPALASTSFEQGRIAAADMFDIPFKRTMATIVPYGIYTIPEVAYVGATEEELKAKGIAYEVGRARYENNARGQITGEQDGMLKLLFDPESKRLLGAHIIGADATELIHLAQMMLVHEGSIEEYI